MEINSFVVIRRWLNLKRSKIESCGFFRIWAQHERPTGRRWSFFFHSFSSSPSSTSFCLFWIVECMPNAFTRAQPIANDRKFASSSSPCSEFVAIVGLCFESVHSVAKRKWFSLEFTSLREFSPHFACVGRSQVSHCHYFASIRSIPDLYQWSAQITRANRPTYRWPNINLNPKSIKREREREKKTCRVGVGTRGLVQIRDWRLARNSFKLIWKDHNAIAIRDKTRDRLTFCGCLFEFFWASLRWETSLRSVSIVFSLLFSSSNWNDREWKWVFF